MKQQVGEICAGLLLVLLVASFSTVIALDWANLSMPSQVMIGVGLAVAALLFLVFIGALIRGYRPVAGAVGSKVFRRGR